MGKVYNKLIKWYGIVITKDKDNLNVRSGPGTKYKQCTFSPLKYGTKIGYCDEELDANGNTWYYIKYNGKYGFVASSYIKKIDSPRKLVVKYSQIIYDRILLLKCKHAGGAKSYDDIVSKRITTCATSASVVLQKAGIIPVGKLVSHTNAVKTDIIKKKNTVEKSILGYQYLNKNKCSIVRIGKSYKEIDEKYKKPGIIYIQDSNVCINAGDGYIYSTNNSASELNKYGVYIKNKIKSGYCFTSPILYAIIPNDK